MSANYTAERWLWPYLGYCRWSGGIYEFDAEVCEVWELGPDCADILLMTFSFGLLGDETASRSTWRYCPRNASGSSRIVTERMKDHLVRGFAENLGSQVLKSRAATKEDPRCNLNLKRIIWRCLLSAKDSRDIEENIPLLPNRSTPPKSTKTKMLRRR